MISHFYDPETKLAKLRNQRVMVFDWGGGTLDVCIVQVSKDGTKIVELAHSGIEDRAGDDFDQRLMAELRTRFLQRNVEVRDEDLELQGSVRDRFWSNAENSKIALSKASEATVSVANFFQRNTKIYDLQETLTRHVFESLIAGEVEAAVRCVQRCLTQARLTPGCIDHLVLVGGTSNIPLIREQLEALFGHKVQVAQEPDAAIARGAAIVAAEGWRPFNAVPLGVKLCDGTFFDILKSGDRLDAESSRRIVFYCTDWRVGSANLLFCRQPVLGDSELSQIGIVLQVPTKKEVKSESGLDRIVADFSVTRDSTLQCFAQSTTLGQSVQCEIHDISFGLDVTNA
jgi:molecular chaperone DnaK (HSP70)